MHSRILRESHRAASGHSGSPLAFARLACAARMAASSASTFFFSSSVNTAVARGGGMSCTAGYSGATAGRSGAPAGSPPAWVGISDNIVEQETKKMEPAQTSPSPMRGCRVRQIFRRELRDFNIFATSTSSPDGVKSWDCIDNRIAAAHYPANMSKAWRKNPGWHSHPDLAADLRIPRRCAS